MYKDELGIYPPDVLAICMSFIQSPKSKVIRYIWYIQMYLYFTCFLFTWISKEKAWMLYIDKYSPEEELFLEKYKSLGWPLKDCTAH